MEMLLEVPEGRGGDVGRLGRGGAQWIRWKGGWSGSDSKAIFLDWGILGWGILRGRRVLLVRGGEGEWMQGSQAFPNRFTLLVPYQFKPFSAVLV